MHIYNNFIYYRGKDALHDYLNFFLKQYIFKMSYKNRKHTTEIQVQKGLKQKNKEAYICPASSLSSTFNTFLCELSRTVEKAEFWPHYFTRCCRIH